jgi:heat-inducible transcriptional repressor
VLTAEAGGVNMDLNDRKLKILTAIVRDYIETAEAVGSRTISKKYDFGVGAATIRNEMADLEDLGYLTQPHTSAGRIPSEKGYKLYVDSLMKKTDLDENDKILMQQCIANNVNQIKELMQHTSKLLSKLTNYTTVALSSNFVEQSKIKHIQLVELNAKNMMLIVVTEKGNLKNINISKDIDIDQEKLNIISNILTSKLQHKSIVDLDEDFIKYIKSQISDYSIFFDQLLNIISNNIVTKESDISLSGATNIFNFPEFNDILKAKAFLNMLEEKDVLADIVNSKGIVKENVNIIIGSDNSCDIAKDCSIITATYIIDGVGVGKIGFIGPTRMDYAKIYSMINYMGLLINQK